MQVVSSSSPAPKFVEKERFAEIYGKLSDDFGSKLKIRFTEEKEEKDRHNNLEKLWWNQDEIKSKTHDDDDGEFSFASVNAENSPITADEAFEDGHIRPIYPLFNRNILLDPEEKALRLPLKKLFVENEEAAASSTSEETEPMGPYCSWSSRTVKEDSPGTCRKSNSTGFSKLWRFRDLVLRSNSDGKDAFVFLNHRDGGDKNHSSPSSTAGVKRTDKEKTRTQKKMKARSAHEKLYMRNRVIREEGKRRSYLPYKHVGFFTNVNCLTRNVHPF